MGINKAKSGRLKPDYTRSEAKATQNPKYCPGNSPAFSVPWPRPRLGNAVVVALQRHNKHHIPRTADQPDSPRCQLCAQQQASSRPRQDNDGHKRTDISHPHLLLLLRHPSPARLPSRAPALLCPCAARRQRGRKGGCEVDAQPCTLKPLPYNVHL